MPTVASSLCYSLLDSCQLLGPLFSLGYTMCWACPVHRGHKQAASYSGLPIQADDSLKNPPGVLLSRDLS